MQKGWPDRVPTIVNIIALVAVGLMWVCGTAYYLANYNHSLNRANCAAAMVFLSCCVWLVVAEVYPTFDAAVAWYVSIPGVILAGITLVDSRAAWVQTAPLTSLLSPIDIDLRVRYILHEALFGHATASLPAYQRALVRKDQATRAAQEGKRLLPAAVGYGGVAEESLPLKPSGAGGSVMMTTPGLAEDMVELEQEEDMETRVALAQRILSRASAASKEGDGSDPIHEAESVYAYGLSRFRSSAWIHLWVSRYHQAYKGNKHLQMTHLLQAGRKSASLDVQYAIFTTRRALDETGSAPSGTGIPGAASGAGAGAGGKATALSRVAFEKYLADAKESVRAALGAQARFWAELCNVRPDLDKLQKLVSTMASSSDAATTCFRQISRINAQSLAAIRLQAEFTAYALNDPERAALLVAEANRIEEGTLKELANTAGKRFMFLERASVGIMGDASGLLVVSASPGSLGTILSASPAACRLLGYPKWQLERRSVELLVPPPVSDFHGAILRNFLATGHSRLGDLTTQMLLQHRSGFLTPILFTWHEVDTPSGPAFEALIQPVDVKDEYLMIDSTLAVCSATAKAMSHLALDANGLARREFSLRSLLASAEAAGHPGRDTSAAPPMSARGLATGVRDGTQADMMMAYSPEAQAAAAEKAANEAWHTLMQQLQSPMGALVSLLPVNSHQPGVGTVPGGAPTPIATPFSTGRAHSAEHTPSATTTGRGFVSEGRRGRRQSTSKGSSNAGGSKRGSLPPLKLQQQEAAPTVVRAFLVKHHAASGDDFYTVTWTWPTAAESGGVGGVSSRPGGGWAQSANSRPSHFAELSDEAAPNSRTLFSAPPHKTSSAGALGSCPFLSTDRPAAGPSSLAMPKGHGPATTGPTTGGRGAQGKGAATPDAVTVSSETGGAEDGEDRSEVDVGSEEGGEDREARGGAVVQTHHVEVVTAADLLKASSPRGLQKMTSGKGSRTSGGRAVPASRSSHSDAAAEGEDSRLDSRLDSMHRGSQEHQDTDEEEEDDVGSTEAPSKMPAKRPSGQYGGMSGGGGGGTGGEGSVASSSRSVTTRRLIARFRRVIDEDKQPMMLTLSRLRVIALVVSVIAAAVAIVLEVISLDALRFIDRTVEVVHINQELIQAVMGVRHSMAVVAHFNQGQSINTSQAFGDERLAWATAHVMSGMRDVQRLYDTSKEAGGQLFSIYTTPNVDYVRTTLDGGSNAATHITVRMSLHEAVTEFMYAAYRLAQLPRQQITLSTLDFLPILNNAVPGRPFFEAVNRTVGDSLAVAADSSVRIRTLLTTVLSSIIGVLGASCVVVLFPLVLAFEREKDGLFKEFLALPPVVLNSLRVQTERRLQAIQNEDLDDGGDADESVEDGQGGAGGQGQDFEAVGMDGTPGAGRSGEGVLLPTDEDGDFDWRMLMQASSGGPPGVSGSRGSISMGSGALSPVAGPFSVKAKEGPRFSRVAFAENAAAPPTLGMQGGGPRAPFSSPQAGPDTMDKGAPLLAKAAGVPQAQKAQEAGWFAGLMGYNRTKSAQAASNAPAPAPTAMVVVTGPGPGPAGGLSTPTASSGAGMFRGSRGTAARSKRHASAWVAQQGRQTTGKSVVNGMKLLGVTTLPLLVLLVVLLVSLFQSQVDITDLQRFANAASAFRQRSYVIRTAYSSLRRALIQYTAPAFIAPDITTMRRSLADLQWWGTHLHLLAPLEPAEEDAADPRDMIARTRGLGRGLNIRGLSSDESQMLAGLSAGSTGGGVLTTMCGVLAMGAAATGRSGECISRSARRLDAESLPHDHPPDPHSLTLPPPVIRRFPCTFP